MSSNGKVAIVTGAGSGIGRAVALALLRPATRSRWPDGARTPLAAGGAEAGDAGVAGARRADRRRRSGVRAGAVRRASRSASAVWICCSTTPAPARRAIPMEELTFEQWQNVVDVNLTGVFLCTQEAIRIMKAQTPRGGRIINNGSISAHAPRPNSAPYTATKHAVTGLTKSTALDGRTYDIACGQIDIGNALTEHGRAHGERRAAGERARSRSSRCMDVAARRRGRGAHGEPAARRQRAVHDDHGDEDAVRRPRLTLASPRAERRRGGVGRPGFGAPLRPVALAARSPATSCSGRPPGSRR